MGIVGTARVRCTECGIEHDCELIQSINTRTDPAAKVQLLRGELNVLDCECGKRTQLAANVLFHDPDADYLCQVCPGGELAMEKAAAAFRVSGASGTQRLVPSLNALIEKVKLLEAGLEDWAIEMTKILLLASIGTSDVDRVLLFQSIDRDERVIRWVLFDEHGEHPELVASPLAAYDKLAVRTNAKPRTALHVDRTWAVRSMITNSN